MFSISEQIDQAYDENLNETFCKNVHQRLGDFKRWRPEIHNVQVGICIVNVRFSTLHYCFWASKHVFSLQTRSTLFREPGCMLARMFASEDYSMQPSCQDETGAYLIDR